MTTRLPVTLVALVLVLVLLPGTASAAAPPAQVVTGRHLFGQECASCHQIGAPGTPRPAGSGGLDERAARRLLAPSLHGVGALAADFYLRTGYMPLRDPGAQPRRSRVLLADGQIRAIVAYVASQGGGPAIPTPSPGRGDVSDGMRLFTDHCAGCHQIAGVGGEVSGAVAPPLGADTPVEIAEAVRIGPYVMPRFTVRAISDRQLDSIIAYVEYTHHPDDRGGWPIGDLGPVPEGLVTWGIAVVALVAICVVIGTRLPRES